MNDHGTPVSVVGIGKLGAPLAASLASKGFRVIAVDTDAAKVAALNRGEAPVFEPGLAEMLREHGKSICATQSVREAVRDSGMTFLVVPTPSEADGGFSLRYVLAACEEVGQALQDKDGHIVVLTSTVMPGATGGPVREALERASGKRCGEGFGLCYSPEFIALGSVIRDLLRPDFILIGESDTRSGEALAGLYREFCETEPAIARMNFVNAELTKLAVNTYVTTKISYANMLSEICERLPAADVDVVTSALGLDSRIGRKYLKGATGFGGPCFPRDNVAFMQLARLLGTRAVLAEATHTVNQAQTSRLARIVTSHLPKGGRAGILGLSYKPGTDVTTESPGLSLAQELRDGGVSVSVYDPAGLDNARPALDGRAASTATALECVQSSDVIVIATPWDEFRSLPPDAFARKGEPRTLIDCWRLFDAKQYAGVVNYVALGIGPNDTLTPGSVSGADGDE